jgi:hypothetical protein
MAQRLRKLHAAGLRVDRNDESGLAMIVAISVVMLMTMIPLAIFTQGIQQMPLSRHGQDHEAALAAAEAGVDEYLNHLAQNQNYWTYSAGNPPPDGNDAFTDWVAVPGPNNNGGSFRYSVNTTQTASTGIVYITSSGKVRDLIRTVKVGLRRQGFLDYLWLTDYEIIDPTLSGANASQCQFRAWQRNTAVGGTVYGPNSLSSCQAVYWTTQAVMNGPVHSNDGLYVCGNPQFNGDTDTYYNQRVSNSVAGSTSFGGPGAFKANGSCSNSPDWSRTGDPASGSLLAFPPANTEIKLQADGSVGGTGCLYTGNTTITLKSTGKMDVVSPRTLSTNSGCAPGTNLNLPANGVIYVQNVPTASGDPNRQSCSGTSCNGIVSLSGTLRGQLTIAAQDDIVIVGNTQYNTYPGGTDVLGLVADNDIYVRHPVTSGGANAAGSLTNPRIDAAMLSLNHSIYVQNWNKGAPLGVLTVNGVITQKFRGPVGTFQAGTPPVPVSGYDKDYNYDTRLKYLSPPYFLSPTQSAWVRLSYAELKPDDTP